MASELSPLAEVGWRVLGTVLGVGIWLGVMLAARRWPLATLGGLVAVLLALVGVLVVLP